MESKKPSNTLIQTFDFEGSGAFPRYHPAVAIGITTLHDGNLHSKTVLSACHEGLLGMFEPRCWTQFWLEFPSVLNDLMRPPPPLEDPDLYFRQMAIGFVDITRQNEAFAIDKNLAFTIGNDNQAYDAFLLQRLLEQFNQDILKAYPDYLEKLTAQPEGLKPKPGLEFFYPLPWSFLTPGKYGACRLVDFSNKMEGACDMAIALVKTFTGIDLEAGPKLGKWELLNQIFDIPPAPEKFEHDHLPDNDAYVIAWQAFVMDEIKKGNIKLRDPIPPKSVEITISDASSSSRSKSASSSSKSLQWTKKKRKRASNVN